VLGVDEEPVSKACRPVKEGKKGKGNRSPHHFIIFLETLHLKAGKKMIKNIIVAVNLTLLINRNLIIKEKTGLFRQKVKC